MKDRRIIIRISEDMQDRWQAAADRKGMSLSEYIRYATEKQQERDEASLRPDAEGQK